LSSTEACSVFMEALSLSVADHISVSLD
jgi:hypothetical protein